MARRDLPTGTITFLFTDIEGSTRLLQVMGSEFEKSLRRHQELIRSAVDAAGGVVVKSEADGFFAVFQSATAAVNAAVEIQRAMAAEPWPTPWPVRTRIGVHTGEAVLGGADYMGLDVHRAARIGAAGHGGQIVISELVARLVGHTLGAGVALEDLGLHRLKDMEGDDRLFQVTVEELQASFPPIRTLTTLKGNLPAAQATFIGRQQERQKVIEALQNSRLVTVTGPGGIGKTSLALNAASEVLTAYPDGVWLIEVSRLSDPALLADTIARQLHITASPGESTLETLTARLSRAMALIILDGCEHMVPEVAHLADHILQRTTSIRVLVTSREWLSMRGERLVAVEPLPVPPDKAHNASQVSRHDAVTLFVDRAQSVLPGFELDDASAPLVAEICRRLDGIPLAIELAAARLSMLSLSQLLERLDRQFSVLGSRPGAAVPHQQTLETTLDWSYDALAPVEAQLFNRLAVFSGGFTIDAVEAVCAGGEVDQAMVLDLLGRLVETSLVTLTDGEPARYRLLEPIAQYARMRLAQGEGPARLQERHAAYFVEVTGKDEPLGAGQNAVLQRLDRERHNLRAALTWLDAHGRSEDILRMAGNLRWYWVIRRDVPEGWHWLNRGLEGGSTDPILTARGLNGIALLSMMKLDFDRANECFEQALALYAAEGDEAGVARETYHLSVVAWFRDDLEEARRLGHEAEELARKVDDRWIEGWTLAVQGTIARCLGDLSNAQSYLWRSHGLISANGGLIDTGWSHLRLGALARDQGDFPGAVDNYTSGKEMLQRAGDALGAAHADAGLGAVAWLQGEHDRALGLFRGVLEGFGLNEEATSNLFELKTMIQGNPPTRVLMDVVEHNRQRAAQVEGQVGARAALAEYLYHMGKTAQRAGEPYRAWHPLVESLRLCLEAVDGRGAAIAAAALGGLIRAKGDPVTAGHLYALAERTARRDRLVDWPPPDEQGYMDSFASTRAALGSRWDEIDANPSTWEDALAMAEGAAAAAQ